MSSGRPRNNFPISEKPARSGATGVSPVHGQDARGTLLHRAIYSPPRLALRQVSPDAFAVTAFMRSDLGFISRDLYAAETVLD